MYSALSGPRIIALMTCERVHKRAGNTQQAVRSMLFCPKRAATLLICAASASACRKTFRFASARSHVDFFCFLFPQLFVIYVALDMPLFTDCRRASLKPRPRRTLQQCAISKSLSLCACAPPCTFINNLLPLVHVANPQKIRGVSLTVTSCIFRTCPP